MPPFERREQLTNLAGLELLHRFPRSNDLLNNLPWAFLQFTSLFFQTVSQIPGGHYKLVVWVGRVLYDRLRCVHDQMHEQIHPVYAMSADAWSVETESLPSRPI